MEFTYPIPWWASMLILLALGVLIHLGVHAMLQSVAARKESEETRAPEPTVLERIYRLPWQWLATSWLVALWVSSVTGGLIGEELLNSFLQGAAFAGSGSLSSSWLGGPIREGVAALIKRVTK